MTFLHNASPIALLVFLVCAGVLLKSLAKLGGGRRIPNVEAKPLMTARELAMLRVFEELLPAHRIHAQVAMGALLKAIPPRGRSATPADRNAFAQKIVDFVVQDPATGAVIALIEVDDSSHRSAADRERDRMTAKAGYRTLRVPGRAKPTIADVRPVLEPLGIKIAEMALAG
jgi:hypothetical protein